MISKFLLVAILWMNDGSFKVSATLFDDARSCIQQAQVLQRHQPAELGAAQGKIACIPVEFDKADGQPGAPA